MNQGENKEMRSVECVSKCEHEFIIWLIKSKFKNARVFKEWDDVLGCHFVSGATGNGTPTLSLGSATFRYVYRMDEYEKEHMFFSEDV